MSRDPSRIVGIDIARGLAVLGMFGAHIGVTEPFAIAEPSTWLDVVNGRSSILFALLAGVSIALISGGREIPEGLVLLRARQRILVRAAMIFVIGGALELLGTAIAVILPVYAVLFVVAILFLRWPPRHLFIAAAALSIVAPAVAWIIGPTVESTPGEPSPFASLVITGNYPALIWIVFVLAGLGIGRLDLTTRATRMRLLVVGIALAVVGYSTGMLAEAGADSRFGGIATIDPHSGSPFEVIGSTGCAVAVLALCLSVATRAGRFLFPIAAVGSLALSAYATHIVVLFFLGDDSFRQSDNTLYVLFILVALAACSVWALALGRGPLERLLASVTRLATRQPPHSGDGITTTPPHRLEGERKQGES